MDVEIGNHKIVIKKLTRGQIRALRDRGIVITRLDKLATGSQIEAQDIILDMVYPDGEADVLSPAEGWDLLRQIIQFSYAGEETLKKSDSPPRSSSPRGGSNAGNAGQPGSRRKGTARRSTKKSG